MSPKPVPEWRIKNMRRVIADLERSLAACDWQRETVLSRLQQARNELHDILGPDRQGE